MTFLPEIDVLELKRADTDPDAEVWDVIFT